MDPSCVTACTARFRPPEAWRSPVVSTWEVWRPLCAKLGGNPAGFSKEPPTFEKTHSFRGNLLEIRVGNKWNVKIPRESCSQNFWRNPKTQKIMAHQ